MNIPVSYFTDSIGRLDFITYLYASLCIMFLSAVVWDK